MTGNRNLSILLLLVSFGICAAVSPVLSQEKEKKNEKESLDIDKEIEELYQEGIETESYDTSYVNYQVENWSIRAFGLFKDHSFQIREGDNRINYVPRNRYGLGLGAAYFPLLLDLSINIKSRDKDPTTRFDAQFDVILKEHFVGVIIQDYKGFEVRGSLIEEPLFRQDIESFAFMTTYAYLFNAKKMSVGSILSGLHKQKKSAGTFSVGGFLHYVRVKGDSSLIPSSVEDQFNPDSRLSRYRQAGFGISGGYGHIFRLPKDFFIFLGIMPGIGIAWKKLEYDDQPDQRPVDPFMYRINIKVSMGYNGKKYYIILSGGDDISTTSINSNSQGSMNIAKTKLIFGWKFKK